jgi:UDP:flavonoid glycosyltransferase YjiC (YdhE family)
MARIAFAWELGGEYGHVMSCSGLARGLEPRGHKIAFMFRELRQLRVVPESRDYDIFQAPRSAHEGEGVSPNPASYAEIMLGTGYRDPREVIGLVGGWRSLFSRWKPDLIVVDFSPTALAAARTLGIPCVNYGNGFFIPPIASPLPAFRVDAPPDPALLLRSDAQALASVNTALVHFGAAPLPRLADLFVAAESFLCTFPEVDHYGARELSGYWGPRVRFDRGADVTWPHGLGKKVFAYVKKDLPQLNALLDIIARSPERVVAYIPDLDAERRARFSGRNHIYSERPIRLENFLKTCDMMISHGGEIAIGGLLYGIPQLVFPGHYEQYITAVRVHQLGCGFWCGPTATAADVERGYTQVLAAPSFINNARAFARRYSAFSPAEQRRRIVARIEELLAPAGAILSPHSNNQGPQR